MRNEVKEFVFMMGLNPIYHFVHLIRPLIIVISSKEEIHKSLSILDSRFHGCVKSVILSGTKCSEESRSGINTRFFASLRMTSQNFYAYSQSLFHGNDINVIFRDYLKSDII